MSCMLAILEGVSNELEVHGASSEWRGLPLDKD
jgi:hypothetical protein